MKGRLRSRIGGRLKMQFKISVLSGSKWFYAVLCGSKWFKGQRPYGP